MTLPPQIPRTETAEGRIDILSWLIVLQKAKYDTISQSRSASDLAPADTDWLFTTYLTLHHEIVHFWHAISTRFLYRYTCDYLHTCLHVLHALGQERPSCDDFPFTAYKKAFGELDSRLLLASTPDSTYGAIRARDVVEGCAVLCSYRMSWPRGSHGEFLDRLDHDHPPSDSQTQYRVAYKYATSLLDDVAFDIFAPACYLALQYGNPGDALKRLLQDAQYLLREQPKAYGERREDIGRALRKRVELDPLSFLLLGRDMQEDDCFPLIIRKRIPQGRDSHVVLDPYVKTVAMATHPRINDIFARPYKYFWEFYFNRASDEEEAVELREFVSELLPPLFAPAGDILRRFMPMGLGKRFGKSYLGSVIGSYAMAGLVERIVFGTRHPMLCPHQECPFHKTGLCQKYYAFPLVEFNHCGFPEILEQLRLKWLPECEASWA